MSDNPPIRLSAQAFIEALLGKGIQDLDGQEHNFLENRDDGIVVAIHDVVVEEDVSIQNDLQFDYNIILKDLAFHKRFIISGNFKRFIIDKGVFHYVSIRGAKFERFYISAKILDNFNISHVNSEKFIIVGGEYKLFEIRISKYDKRSYIDEFKISNGIFQNFHASCDPEKRFPIYDFHISGGEFEQFTIGGKMVDVFRVSGGKIEKFSFSGGGDISSLKISNGEFGTFDINRGIFQTLRVSGGIFRKINLYWTWAMSVHFTINVTFDLILEKSFIGDLVFKSIIKNNGAVYIRNLKVNQLSFEDFLNQGFFSIQNLKYDLPFTIIPISEKNVRHPPLRTSHLKFKPTFGKISFQNSWLGNMVLLNFDINSFQSIIINNCKLDSVSTYGKHFPIARRGKQNWLFTGENQVQEPEKLSEFYNQLHLAMQKQGHRANEMHYYAAYMEWHRLHLKQTRQEWNTRVSMCLNKWSTNYGQNWWKGTLITLFIVGPLFYIPYTVFLPGVAIDWQYLTWENFLFFLGEYFNFLNPAHRVDFIPNLPPGPCSIFFDFLGRIFIGFMIYQIITSFRRFGRR